ncbi:MAG: hypothetical protein ABIJ84_04025, partial [bacterium]
SKILNYLLYSYKGLLQDTIYGISLVVIGICLSAIFLDGFKTDKKFIFRSVVIFGLLSLAMLLNNEAIVLIIPHQITI